MGYVQVRFNPNTNRVELQGAGTVIGTENILDFIQNSKADIYVIENYKIRPQMKNPANNRRYTHQWDSGDTMRYIGALQLHAHVLSAEFVLQQPACKPAG